MGHMFDCYPGDRSLRHESFPVPLSNIVFSTPERNQICLFGAKPDQSNLDPRTHEAHGFLG